MKHLYIFWLMGAVWWLTGCMSEEEKAHKSRLEKLEKHYLEVEGSVQAWQDAMAALHGMRTTEAADSSREALDSVRLRLIEAVEGHYPQMGTERNYWATRGLALDLDHVMYMDLDLDRANAEGNVSLVQDLRNVGERKRFHNLQDRYDDGEWPYNLAEFDQVGDDEEQEETFGEMHRALDFLDSLQWVVAAEPWLVVAPRIVENSFEGGEMVSRLLVYDMAKGKVVDITHVRGTPEIINYVYGDTPEKKIRSMVGQLPDRVYSSFYRSLKTNEPRR